MHDLSMKITDFGLQALVNHVWLSQHLLFKVIKFCCQRLNTQRAIIIHFQQAFQRSFCLVYDSINIQVFYWLLSSVR